MVLVNVKGIGEGLPASRKGAGGQKKLKEVRVMEKTKNQNQIQEQTETQNQTQTAQKLAQKLLSGELLTPQETILLTDREVAKEVSFYLWHFSFWGW